MVVGSMTGVSGPRGAGRFAGPAALAGQRWLRLAWRGLLRPCRSGLVTEAMISRDARVIWSGGKGARVPDRAAHGARGADERDPQRVLAGERGGGADHLPDGVTGAQQRPDLLLGPVGGPGAQHHPGAFHAGLERARGGLDLPPGVIQL